MTTRRSTGTAPATYEEEAAAVAAAQAAAAAGDSRVDDPDSYEEPPS